MSNIKTAVSINKSLFKEAETLAKKLEISRSRLFAIALENFIRKQENRELLKRINQSYSKAYSSDEKIYRKQIRDYHRRSLEDEW